LRFDGSNDYMLTNSIDFTATDKMTVFAGVRKLSDAAFAVMFEHGVGGSDALVYGIAAPGQVAANYRFDMRGGGLVTTAVRTTYTAPITNVLTSSLNYAGTSLNDEIIVNINGQLTTQANTGTGPLASSNFGNYPLYIGMRGGSTSPLNGRLYSLITRGVQSTESEIANTEQWVNQRTRAY
jgi:hypothetical protein